MRITFLGTAGAGGVPRYGCDCRACTRARADLAWQRLPCSALIEADGQRILLDAGLMDLHERFPAGTLDAIVLTHFHADHVQGLFHLRWGKGARIPVYAPPDAEGCADLYKHPGLLEFRPLRAFEPFTLGALRITPLPLNHSKPTFGYAIEATSSARFAYLTDTLGLPAQTEAFLAAWQADGLAIDCSSAPTEIPGNHNDWSRALASIQCVAPRHAWLTHIGHGLDSWLIEQPPELAPDIHIAHDGAIIEISAAVRSAPQPC
ncbi:phosphonate metabolism protein PhnP [Devosia sp.]|uniref:phosphonate metabolism protein PhnP n=1 Tax=Devosia sp. TaxID=1871048 RepID=UPI002734B7DE|nr:phosphonate metabolism protein PhnP [Devosia sp.]MDP2780137.1 phosphonate metabolism protein PhnP [Devosia sp.]